MDRRFAALLDRLQPALESLLACPPHTGGSGLPSGNPERGVYLLSEGSDHLYVGRTNRLRARYREHCNNRHNDAPFAFKLARQATGRLKAKGGLTRAQLEGEPEFAAAFVVAKRRVTAMDFRWVEEVDPNRQCLLEIYVSIALGTPFNDFENH